MNIIDIELNMNIFSCLKLMERGLWEQQGERGVIRGFSIKEPRRKLHEAAPIDMLATTLPMSI